jgi:hypothetical protein
MNDRRRSATTSSGDWGSPRGRRRSCIYRKIGVTSRTQAIATAFELLPGD